MFEEIKYKFGFGCMRLPMNGEKVDDVEFIKMIEAFLQNGFNYFDTAHGYISGESEKAIKRCLTSRYDRDKYLLTNKLTEPYFKKNEDIRPFFESQLELCGVDYFDFYLMHAQNKDNFEHFKRCRAYETALELKKEGKLRHFGISFHDTAYVLDKILSEYPQIEMVQIQLNYIDYEDNSVQGRKNMEVCRKHGKPMVIMEPVKGGSLANLPKDAGKYFDEISSNSYASHAMRFAADFEDVIMVLSGMGTSEQMNDNIKHMKDFKHLTEIEKKAIENVCKVMKSKNVIPCTDCKYCVDGCPQKILIPNLFSCYNAKSVYKDWNQDFYYETVLTSKNGKASDCIKCKKCEKVCPQHLVITSLLEDVAKEFEKKTESLS